VWLCEAVSVAVGEAVEVRLWLCEAVSVAVGVAVRLSEVILIVVNFY
jgi:hypothetical protein